MTASADDGTARRLLKLHAAATRDASSQARALCVGPSGVVFRVALQHTHHDTTWVTALSEAACLRIFFLTRDAIRHPLNGRLVRRLRKHLRCIIKLCAALAETAFTSHFISNVTRRHRAERAVTVVMGECWAALALLLLLPPSRGGDGGMFKRLSTLLCELLAVPRCVVAAHEANARAVWSVENSTAVTTTTTAMCHGVCCVCLDSLDNKNLPTVQLPCCHELHEDCALAWLARKPSCPQCRFDLCQRS